MGMKIFNKLKKVKLFGRKKERFIVLRRWDIGKTPVGQDGVGNLTTATKASVQHQQH